MKIFKYISFLLVLLLMVISLSAQEKKIKRADEIFEAGEYFRAIQEYNAVMKKLENKNQKNEIYFKIGECYFMIGDYKKARSNYKKTAKVRDFEFVSKIRLAEIEIQEGTYEDALLLYNEALEISPNDSIALKGIESANMAINWLTEPTRYKAEKAKHLNSRRNDFSPSVDEKSGYDHIYFSSTRDEAKGKRTSGITGEKFSDLFITKFDRKQEWTDALPIDSLNTEFDEGSPCIFSDGMKFYYTSCRAEKGKKVGCQIYEAQKVDGEWMNPARLDIVPDTVSIGHPTVSPDGNIVYFSARMQGGYGGADIWYYDFSGGDGNRPKNMGPAINSAGDELFPFMRADGTFFYSSTKHPTMGGLDIFIAQQNEKGRWESENMKPPFSSNSNDFGIYYYSNEDKGYFTSDRKGSKQEDIYFFVKPPLDFKLTGIAKDKDQLTVIDSCVVMLFGSDGSIFRDTTSVSGKEGKFNFKLRPKTDYVFVVTKDGYFNGKSRFTTDSLEFDKVFEYEILLESLNKTFEIPNIEFEFGKWELTEPSKRVLDSIVRIMTDNPYLIIELSAHTDMIGTDEANMELSQKRANSVTTYFSSKGIPEGRLVAVGYGESRPKVINKTDLRYAFLPSGTVLDEDFVNSLPPEQQVVANQQNRRIEMKVISNDYIPSLD
ncbi:MAG: OmpA family protein [Bacteroidales bacterium]|nr:OmpA family protein [Bacteroidales bacterium]MDD3860680.1 OmpA family protein [Bacteroidales bacterium]